MSIHAMASLAVAQRLDAGSIDGSHAPIDQQAQDAAGASTPENSATAGLKLVTTYIPTEVITLYVAAVAALRTGNHIPLLAAWITFWLFLALTPIVVWLVTAGKLRAAGQPIPLDVRSWPLWPMAAAAIAFLTWAFALPDSPFVQFSWYSAAIAGLGVLVVATILPLLAQLFQGPTAATAARVNTAS